MQVCLEGCKSIRHSHTLKVIGLLVLNLESS